MIFVVCSEKFPRVRIKSKGSFISIFETPCQIIIFGYVFLEKNQEFKVRHLKANNGAVRNEAADVRLIEQILDPLLESMLGIGFRKG